MKKTALNKSIIVSENATSIPKEMIFLHTYLYKQFVGYLSESLKGVIKPSAYIFDINNFFLLGRYESNKQVYKKLINLN